MAENDAKRTPEKAQADIEALLAELAAEGFTVNGWDDGSLYLYAHQPEYQAEMPRAAAGSGWEIKPPEVS